ncbi:hypothetical protein ABNQ38_12845 [Azospirillum sp. A29]|uniref:hypothetical protein n=1 Tax=Azospirillum sp. A29 TaxID=3160606 RepID=UPI00366EE616
MILSPRFDPVAGSCGKVEPKPSAAHHSRLSCTMKVTQTTKPGQCHGSDGCSFDIGIEMIPRHFLSGLS